VAGGWGGFGRSRRPSGRDCVRVAEWEGGASACGRDFAGGAVGGASGADRATQSEVECVRDRGCGAGARQGESCGSGSSGARGKERTGVSARGARYGEKLDRRGGGGLRRRE